jgi:hypothetical protein
MSLDRDSRYNYAHIMRTVDAAGQLVEYDHFDIRPHLVDTVHPDNREFVVEEGDNWSRIGWRRLGRGRRWWIIADYSQVVDPFEALLPAETLRVIGRLSVPVTAGAVTSLTLTRVTGLASGTVLRVQNLDPAAPTAFDAAVLSVNPTTKVVSVTPTTCPAPGIPTALARVGIVRRETRKLSCPSVNRAFFSALGFGNPLNTLVGE